MCVYVFLGFMCQHFTTTLVVLIESLLLVWEFQCYKLRIGFFPRDCPRDEILPVMSKIWAKLVECGSDIHKRKSAVQLLYAEILTLATWISLSTIQNALVPQP